MTDNSQTEQEFLDPSDLEQDEHYAVLTAILFTSGEVVDADRLAEYFTLDQTGLAVLVAETAGRLRPLGLDIVRAAEGYRLLTSSSLDDYVRQFHTRLRKSKLSRSALEILAIIAYDQPIERSKIDDIRQVSSESTVRTLLDRRLIKVSGRTDAPGRPFLYKTTAQFLETFGLDSLEDLPPRPAIMATTEDETEADGGMDSLPSFDEKSMAELE